MKGHSIMELHSHVYTCKHSGGKIIHQMCGLKLIVFWYFVILQILQEYPECEFYQSSVVWEFERTVSIRF